MDQSMADDEATDALEAVDDEDVIDVPNDKEIIDGINELMQLSKISIDPVIDGSASNPTHLSSKDTRNELREYKLKTKQLLEKLLLKLQYNNETIHELEENIDELETELLIKESSLKKISQQAISAIEECKCEAQDIYEEMTKKYNIEVKKRESIEKVLRQFQVDNSMVRAQLKSVRGMHKKVNSDNAANSYDEITLIKLENTELKKQLLHMSRENESIRLQRDAELLSLTLIGKEVAQFIDASLKA
jgi:hypothetical protein